MTLFCQGWQSVGPDTPGRGSEHNCSALLHSFELLVPARAAASHSLPARGFFRGRLVFFFCFYFHNNFCCAGVSYNRWDSGSSPSSFPLLCSPLLRPQLSPSAQLPDLRHLRPQHFLQALLELPAAWGTSAEGPGCPPAQTADPSALCSFTSLTRSPFFFFWLFRAERAAYGSYGSSWARG